VAEVLDSDNQFLSNSRYPSAACLKAGELLSATQNLADLAPGRREHLEQCVYCQASVATSRPDETMIRRMAEALAQSPAGERESVRPARRWQQAVFAAASFMSHAAPIAVAASILTLVVSPDARLQVAGFLQPAAELGRAPSEQEGWLLDAYRSYARGQTEDVFKWTGKLLNANPKNADVLLLQGQTWMMLGDVQRAKDACQAALAVDPGNRQASQFCAALGDTNGAAISRPFDSNNRLPLPIQPDGLGDATGGPQRLIFETPPAQRDSAPSKSAKAL
jgi:tetratricopeptide (TPR) repeat protein